MNLSKEFITELNRGEHYRDHGSNRIKRFINSGNKYLELLPKLYSFQRYVTHYLYKEIKNLITDLQYYEKYSEIFELITLYNQADKLLEKIRPKDKDKNSEQVAIRLRLLAENVNELSNKNYFGWSIHKNEIENISYSILSLQPYLEITEVDIKNENFRAIELIKFRWFCVTNQYKIGI